MSVKLFWWEHRPNFGDSLSQNVVEFVSGQDASWTPIGKCDLAAIGSIYPWVRDSLRHRIRPVHIWGSGTLFPHKHMKAHKNLKISALRGPITASMAGVTNVPYGDPGLLSDRVWPEFKGQTGEKPGLVLHYAHRESLTEEQEARLGEIFELIDVRNNDAKAVIQKIASCPMVFSSSLHGLVVADAYKRPNWCITPSRTPTTKWMFKFYDYALALGRAIDADTIAVEDIVASTSVPQMGGDFRYFDRTETVKDDLIQAFPAALRAH